MPAVNACCVSNSSSRLAKLAKSATRIGVFALLSALYIFPSAHAADKKQAKSSSEPVTCATCHAGIAATYAHAPMRHAIELPNANPPLETHPNLTTQLNGYTYTVVTKDGHTTYTVSDATGASLSLPVRWMFGQHTQTWVLEKDGLLFESVVSYFPREQALSTTPGDQKLVPHTLMEAMGRPLSVWESRSCFNCHATDALTNGKLVLDKVRPGLDCVRCHLGSEQHMADAIHDNFKTLPKSLKKMPAEDISNFCGQCHRTWDTVIRNQWHGRAFVRFQPYRLALSKCFIGNDPRISCLACHDPHQPVNHDQAFYNGKCQACHSEVHIASATASTATTAKVCPVSKTDCISCHMPKVELPGGHTIFTDHYIRVVKAGEPYPY